MSQAESNHHTIINHHSSSSSSSSSRSSSSQCGCKITTNNANLCAARVECSMSHQWYSLSIDLGVFENGLYTPKTWQYCIIGKWMEMVLLTLGLGWKPIFSHTDVTKGDAVLGTWYGIACKALSWLSFRFSSTRFGKIAWTLHGFAQHWGIPWYAPKSRGWWFTLYTYCVCVCIYIYTVSCILYSHMISARKLP